MKRATILVVPIAFLLLVGGVLAMSSDNYRLDWFTPLTSGGGGPASSTSYAVNLTIGQSAIGIFDSGSYGVCLGYWCSGATGSRVFLPLVLRNA